MNPRFKTRQEAEEFALYAAGVLCVPVSVYQERKWWLASAHSDEALWRVANAYPRLRGPQAAP